MSTVTNISTRGRRRNQTAAAPREESRCAACNATGATPATIEHVYGCANYECPDCGMRAGNHVEGCATFAERVKNPTILDAKTGDVVTLPGGVSITASADAPAPKPKDEPGGDEEPIEEGEDDEDEGLDPVVEDEPDAKGKRELTRVAPPEITAALVRDLQEAIEDRNLVAFAQPLTKAVLCEETHVVGDVEVGCAGVAAVAIVDEKICGECSKMKRKRLLALCVAHGARYAAGYAVDPQLEFQLEIA